MEGCGHAAKEPRGSSSERGEVGSPQPAVPAVLAQQAPAAAAAFAEWMDALSIASGGDERVC